MLPVNEPLFTSREKELLSQCIDSGWISSDGPFVRKFEEAFAEYIGVPYGIAVCNGTAALELAIASLDLEPGSGVIVPTFTIISCVLAIIRNHLRPILVDADPETWCLDMNQTQRLLTRQPNIKAIMAVHIYGHPCDMDPLLELAEQHGLYLIEDAAEVHGAEYCSFRDKNREINSESRGQGTWRKCGSFGHIAAFSFYANKIITTGEGGMVMTDRADLAAKARSLRNLAFQPQQRFLHEECGYNFRMTNLQAAVGMAQMERINQLLERKITQGERYRRFLKNVPGLTLQSVQSYARPVYWVNGILLNPEIPLNAVQMAECLEQKKIQTRPFFWPMHEQPVFRKIGLFQNERYPVAENLARRGLYLPSGMALNPEQIEYVCRQVVDCMEAVD